MPKSQKAKFSGMGLKYTLSLSIISLFAVNSMNFDAFTLHKVMCPVRCTSKAQSFSIAVTAHDFSHQLLKKLSINGSCSNIADRVKLKSHFNQQRV